MALRKPFRAVPIKLGKRYRRKRQVEALRGVLRYLGLAAAAGAVLGTASVALGESGRAEVVETVKPVAVLAGIVREREPRPGDRWGNCDHARAAGTAPIYSHEPGYREGLDADFDGIACEPWRGW